MPEMMLKCERLTDFRCAVDVLNVEHSAQAVEGHFGQGRNQLGRRYQDIDAVRPASEREKSLANSCVRELAARPCRVVTEKAQRN